jgi:hypothetical protein
MLSTIKDKSLNILENIYHTLDSYEDAQNRPKVFSMRKEQENESSAASSEDSRKYGTDEKEDQEEENNSDVNYDELSTNDKFKYLTFELIDIGLFQGQKGLSYIQSTTPYTILDKNLQLNKQVKLVSEKGVKLYHFINDKVYSPLKEYVIVLYGSTQQYLSMFVRVIKENQRNLLDYILKRYENVKVFARDSWLRLDFNNDGKVSLDDLKKGAHELFEFMKNYEYIQKAIDIKSAIYEEAIKLMKKDLKKDEEKQESHLGEDDSKVKKQLKEE